jgi:hypothetical protein
MNRRPSAPEPGTVLRSIDSLSVCTYVHMQEYSRPVYSGELVFVLAAVYTSDTSLLCKCALANGTVGSFWYDASEWEKVEQ